MLKPRFKASFFVSLCVILLFATGCQGESKNSSDSKTLQSKKKVTHHPNKTNRLIHEKSPYLLQHAYNPVDWYPWGDEAFEKAKRENKPVFLSIGYSTCHWCHVMEKESFENEEIAAVMNEHFVSIKVDREERPDVDNVYMSAAQAIGGGGGWPLSVFLTPDERAPFFSGTYFPPEDRWGRKGFKSLLLEKAQEWREKSPELRDFGRRVIAFLNQDRSAKGKVNLDEKVFKKAFKTKAGQFEPKYGGFSGGRKFPMGHNLSFLLRYWERSKDKKALQMVTHTLDQMAGGGIYDQIGGGFHRYATEPTWLLPHFEKMLYDQALLVIAYLEAYQITKKDDFKRIAEEVLEYVLRDMTHAEGGFYSAEDADSEGEEGKFYVWRKNEILQILGKEEGELFCQYYGVTNRGNFEGYNILTARKSLLEFAKKNKIKKKNLISRFAKDRASLLEVRALRIRPHLDDKIMTDWNGLMISAFSFASQVLDEPRYAKAATRSAEFVLKNIQRKDGRLLKRWRDGEAHHLGLVEDYAFFINGLIDLYQVTFNARWLEEAIRLAGEFERLFWDQKNGGFFFSPKDGEKLITNAKEIYDGAIPSGNSVAALAFARLGQLTMKREIQKIGDDLLNTFSAQITSNPAAFPQMLTALDYQIGPSKEIVIAGNKNNRATQKFLRIIYGQFMPRKVVILHKLGQEGKKIESLVPLVKSQNQINNKTTFYICENYACKLPTNNVEKAAQLLAQK